MKTKFLGVVAACVLELTTNNAANASTLIADNTAPYTINQVSIGDNGNEVVPTGSTFVNQVMFWISSSTPAVFNYSVAYSPTSPAFADAYVFRLNDPQPPGSGGCHPYCGDYLAIRSLVGTGPAAPPLTATGSISMDIGAVFMIKFGLYSFTQHVPYDTGGLISNGSYNLTWNVGTSADYLSVLSMQGGDPSYIFHPQPVPVPPALPLFATG